MFSLIAAVGKNRELGKDGKLLFHLPEDMAYFKNTTAGHKVLMGRKTWESLRKKLPNRMNIVATHTPQNQPNQAKDKVPDLIISDLPEFITTHKGTPEEIFVIGGGMLYQETLNYAKRLYLTEIDASSPADTFFPEFDKSNWSRKVIRKGEDNGLKYAFVLYERK